MNIKCPKCNKLNKADDKNCFNCGHRFDQKGESKVSKFLFGGALKEITVAEHEIGRCPNCNYENLNECVVCQNCGFDTEKNLIAF